MTHTSSQSHRPIIHLPRRTNDNRTGIPAARSGVALARCGIVGVLHPNGIQLDSTPTFECRQVDLSRRVGGKLTSVPDVEKNPHEVDFKAI